MRNPVAKFGFRINENKIEGVKNGYSRKGRHRDKDRKELQDDLEEVNVRTKAQD